MTCPPGVQPAAGDTGVPGRTVSFRVSYCGGQGTASGVQRPQFKSHSNHNEILLHTHDSKSQNKKRGMIESVGEHVEKLEPPNTVGEM